MRNEVLLNGDVIFLLEAFEIMREVAYLEATDGQKQNIDSIKDLIDEEFEERMK